jgi:hypothetical protein
MYRLRHAVLTIAGAGTASVDSEDHLGETSADVPLEPGGYSITLAPGWSLERENQAKPAPAPAILISSPLQVFTVVAGERTSIGYMFAADDHLVQTGDGNVGVVTDVHKKAPTPLCDAAAPFVAIHSIAGLPGPGNVESARFSPDERVVYFVVNDGGNRDLRTAERADRAAAFGESRPVTSVNTPSSEAWPSVSPDGLTLFFESNRGGPSRLYAAARATTLDEFGAPEVVEDNHSVLSDGQPFVFANREALYFASNRNLHWQLFRASGNGTLHFGTEARVEIDSASDESAPVPTIDDLALYFSSNRPDGGARGANDIWVARRASPTEPYGAPLDVMELNTSSDDFADWASPDGCRLYFHRNDILGSQLFVAEKTP